MIYWAIDQNENKNVQFSWTIILFCFYQLIMLIFTPKITIQNRILHHVIEYGLIPSNNIDPGKDVDQRPEPEDEDTVL